MIYTQYIKAFYEKEIFDEIFLFSLNLLFDLEKEGGKKAKKAKKQNPIYTERYIYLHKNAIDFAVKTFFFSCLLCASSYFIIFFFKSIYRKFLFPPPPLY